MLFHSENPVCFSEKCPNQAFTINFKPQQCDSEPQSVFQNTRGCVLIILIISFLNNIISGVELITLQ